MKSVFIFLLLLFEVSFPQIFPHRATLVASKDSVFSDEVFTVTYTLTDVVGYFYIGFKEEYFEAVGDDRWEGEIKAGETQSVSFKVRLREKSKEFIQKKVPLTVGFSKKPLDEHMTNTFGGKFIVITVRDYDQLKHKYKTIENNQANVSNRLSLNNSVMSSDIPRIKKTISVDKNTIRQENSIDTSNNKLDVCTELLNKQIVKGQLIDVLVRLKNLSADTIKVSLVRQSLYSKESGKKLGEYVNNNVSYTTILPFQEYTRLLDPLAFIGYNNSSDLPGIPWYYWEEGKYEYEIVYRIGSEVYCSNRLPIDVEAVPDSLRGAFKDLQVDLNRIKTLEEYEVLFGKYKGTFYEKEYFYQLLTLKDYYYGIVKNIGSAEFISKVKRLYKEFILKYPDTKAAYNLFENVYRGRSLNAELLKDIINKLKEKRNQSSILRLVLDNQKKYWLKELYKYED